MQRQVPSLMSFFLSTRGFRPYVDHRWSTGGSKDITSHLISQPLMFLLVLFFSPNKHTHKHPPNNIKMPSLLRQITWECGDCTTTNRGREQLPCLYCRAENPHQYEILAGSAPAATAQTTYVMHIEQHNIVRAASETHVAVVPCLVVDRALLTKHLQGMMIDIVGTETNENGRSCHAHKV